MTVTEESAKAAPEDKKTKKALSEGKRAERRLAWWLCAPAVIVMLAVTAWPIIYSVWLSLKLKVRMKQKYKTNKSVMEG